MEMVVLIKGRRTWSSFNARRIKKYAAKINLFPIWVYTITITIKKKYIKKNENTI